MAKSATSVQDGGPAPPPVILEQSRTQVVERTSLANRNVSPDEVTVRFNRWHAHNNTAYQKGQFAGFRWPDAQRLIAAGHCVLVETVEQRRDVAARMVTK